MSYNTRNSGRPHSMGNRPMGPRSQNMSPRIHGPGPRGQGPGGRGQGGGPMSRMMGSGSPMGAMGRQQSPRPQQQSGYNSPDVDNSRRSPASGGDSTGSNNSQNASAIDPTSYTQPAYTTQPGYNSQTPIKSGVPQGGSPQPQQPQPQPQQQPKEQPQPQQQQTQQQQKPPQEPEPQPQQVQSQPTEPKTPTPSQQQEDQPMEEDQPSQDSQGQDSDKWTKDDEADGNADSQGSTRSKKFGNRPWFRKSGAYNVKISKKIRKRRQNARLRHILSPKNAMMVLHELHPELKIIATEQLNAANQMVYTVEIEIEGKTYQGHGMSKLAAKQAGCENALKAVLLEKMAKSNVKVDSSESMKVDNEEDNAGNNGSANPVEENTENVADDNAVSENPDGENAVSENTGGETTPPNRPRRQHAEDDVPWGSLASFALYRLFAEWQSQGIQLPMAANSNIPPLQQPIQKAPIDVQLSIFQMAPMKKIPEDANKKHPVQLLNQLRPGSQYSEKREGNPPNLTFTFHVVVDGQTYQGIGSSKKDAKRECAKSALIAMGVKYD